MPFCPHCAQELPNDGAESCVFCGKRLPMAGAQLTPGVEPAESEKKTVMGGAAVRDVGGGMPAMAPPLSPAATEVSEAPNRSTVKGFQAPQGGAWPSLPGGPSPAAASPPAMQPWTVPSSPTPPAVPPRAAPTPPAQPVPTAPTPAPPPPAAAVTPPGQAPFNDDMAATVMDESPLVPVPSVKVEGGPYEIEDPTPKDPPGAVPPMWHPEVQAAAAPPPPVAPPMPAPPMPPPGGAPGLEDLALQATAEDSFQPVPQEAAPEPQFTDLRADASAGSLTEEGEAAGLPEDQPRKEEKANPPPSAPPTAREQMGQLQPMPSEGPTGFFAGLGYFLKVTGARWKRGRVKLAFQWEIFYLEKDLKKVQEELGRHAWTSRLNNPMLNEQTAALDALETERATAQAERQRQAQLTAQEEEAFAGTKQALEEKIKVASEKVDALKADTSEKSAELKNLRQRQGQEGKEVSRLASARKAKEGQAGKAKDPEQQASLAQEAAQIGLDIQKAAERKAATDREVAELSGPVEQLNKELAEARAAKAALDKELSAARAELNKKTLASRDEEKRQATEEERLDKEISRGLAEMGQTMDEQRLAGPGLDAYYGRLNGLREQIQEKEQSIQLLDAERENFNKKAYKNGVIVLATAGGIALAVTLTMVILFTFVFGD